MAIIRKRRTVATEENLEEGQVNQVEFDLVPSQTEESPLQVMIEAQESNNLESNEKNENLSNEVQNEPAEKTVVIRTRQRKKPESPESSTKDTTDFPVQLEATQTPEEAAAATTNNEIPQSDTELSVPQAHAGMRPRGRRPFDRSHPGGHGSQDGTGQRSETVLPPLGRPTVVMPDIYGRPEPRNDQDNGKPRLSINELTRLNMKDLRELANFYGISHEDMVTLKKQEIIFSILKAHTERGGIIYAYGSLEILPDGYGFLRSPQNSYLPGPDDIYISPSQIRLFALKTGDTVFGQIRSPKEGERFFAMLRVETVNYDDPAVAQSRIPLDNLTPL